MILDKILIGMDGSGCMRFIIWDLDNAWRRRCGWDLE